MTELERRIISAGDHYNRLMASVPLTTVSLYRRERISRIQRRIAHHLLVHLLHLLHLVGVHHSAHARAFAKFHLLRHRVVAVFVLLARALLMWPRAVPVLSASASQPGRKRSRTV